MPLATDEYLLTYCYYHVLLTTYYLLGVPRRLAARAGRARRSPRPAVQVAAAQPALSRGRRGRAVSQ